MKSIAPIVLAAAVMAMSTATPAEAAVTRQVKWTKVSVRTGARVSATRVGYLYKNRRVSVIAVVSNYAMFKFGTRFRWVYNGALGPVASAPSSPPASTPGTAMNRTPYAVTASSLNVRSGPSTSSGTVSPRLRSGQVIYATRRSGVWRGFTRSGRLVWTHSSYLRPVRPTSTGTTPTPTGPPASTPGTAMNRTAYAVTASRLNVRSGPSTGSGTVSPQLASGQVIYATRRSGVWRGFTRSGRLVWTHASYLRPVRPTSTGTTPTPSSSTPTLPGTATPSRYYLVNSATLIVRATPRLGSTVRGRLTRNTRIRSYRTSGLWRGFTYNGRLAWVYSPLLRASGARPTPTPPRTTPPSTSTPPRTMTRSGSRSRGVGNNTIGASMSQNCSGSHSSASSRSNSNSRLTGKLLGRTFTVGGITSNYRLNNPRRSLEVSTTSLDILGSGITFSRPNDIRDWSREREWIKDVNLARVPVGPFQVVVKASAGAKIGIDRDINVSRSGVSLTLAPFASIYGEAKLELEAFVARAGVKGTLDLVKASVPLTASLRPGSVTLSASVRVACEVAVSAYIEVGAFFAKKKWEVSLGFLSFTLAEVRIPIVSATIRGS